jgi:hypothetical protein
LTRQRENQQIKEVIRALRDKLERKLDPILKGCYSKPIHIKEEKEEDQNPQIGSSMFPVSLLMYIWISRSVT